MKKTSTPEAGRVLGVDYGSSRIGISISDPLRILAQEYDTISNTANALASIRDIVRREDVSLVVVGMPYTLKGTKGQKAKEVELFVQRLEKEVDIPVTVWDERFTTTIAQRTLLQMGTRVSQRRSRKGKLDSMAAALLLQSFLDSAKNSLAC